MNYLESERDHFVMCDDKTGKVLDVSRRVDAVETLRLLHEVHTLLEASRPSVSVFEIHFAICSTCRHLGWAPGDIAVIEQYARLGLIAEGGSVPATR